MAEVLVQFQEPISAEGRFYVARVCGRAAPNGDGWEGWIEFVPGDGSAVLRSRRETRQSSRDDLLYWATGLTRVYLEGSLERTLSSERVMPATVVVEPAYYDGPAPEPARVPVAVTSEAVLDPFSVYAKGEDLLRQELNALSIWHLRNIVQAYGLFDVEAPELQVLTRPELAERIILAVRSSVEAARER